MMRVERVFELDHTVARRGRRERNGTACRTPRVRRRHPLSTLGALPEPCSCTNRSCSALCRRSCTSARFQIRLGCRPSRAGAPPPRMRLTVLFLRSRVNLDMFFSTIEQSCSARAGYRRAPRPRTNSAPSMLRPLGSAAGSSRRARMARPRSGCAAFRRRSAREPSRRNRRSSRTTSISKKRV